MLKSHMMRGCTVGGLAVAAVLCSSGRIHAQNPNWNYYDHDPYAERYHNGRYDAYSPVAEIEPGTVIEVRTNEPIDTDRGNGRLYPATVQDDVWDYYNRLAVPMIRRGSPAQLVARQERDGDLVLDLDSVTVNGRRYGISTSPQRVVGTTGRQDDFLHNDKTPEYVGGGAILGTIIGALTGGGKGAAIGAVGGAAAGAGAEYLTRGREVRVPAGAVLTFRTDQPLTVAVATNRNDRGDIRDRDRDRR